MERIGNEDTGWFNDKLKMADDLPTSEKVEEEEENG